MIIKYGIENNSVDVTEICLTKLNNNNIITIPSQDNNRGIIFSDHLLGVLKKIFIIINELTIEYDYYYTINIDILNNSITTVNHNDNSIINIIHTDETLKTLHYKLTNNNEKLKSLHSKLKIMYGNFNEELPEQKMAVRYLNGCEKVLEIGGNIGRNTLIIASLLQNDNNFLTLECDSDSADKLKENRDLNNLHFHIEKSALSNRKLIQRGWDTIPSDTLIEGYNWVNTITLSELKTKYNIDFDTLVLDCEGAFYYILIDMPEILNNINLIIMENDYQCISEKNMVDETLKKNNFYRDYVETGGWGVCYNHFFEVWKKN